MVAKQMKSRNGFLIALGVAILVLLLLPPFYPTIFVIVLTQALIFGIVAMSLDVLIGYTNLGSLGHGSFFAVGAYTTAILVTRYHTGFGLSLFAALRGYGSFWTIGSFVPEDRWIYFLLIPWLLPCPYGSAMRYVTLAGEK
jgi:ABC-type branched-subunit amino acid transport system permease subunit